MQLRNNQRGVARQASALNNRSLGSARVNVISMSLSGKSVNFTKIISMEEMVTPIEQEQIYDDNS